MGFKSIVRRPDGDLTIEGTSVWMPADLDQVKREIQWTHQRLTHLLAAETFLMAEQSPILRALMELP